MNLDKSKILLIALIAAVVAVSGCTSQNADNAATDNTPSGPANDTAAEPQNNTVFYTDSGFRPATVEIQQGETVTWLDRSSKNMWVATDRHPTHRQYDGTSTRQHCPDGNTFDQCDTGARYSFTFDKTGEWSYHNHVNAGDTGKVVVN